MKGLFAAAFASVLVMAASGGAAIAQEKKAGAEARKQSPAVSAMRARQKTCGAEWKQAKAAGTTKGQKWPQYWSACNKRLKAAGT